MANNDNYIKQLQSTDDKIEKTLFGADVNLSKKTDRINDLLDSLNDVNSKYRKVTGQNLIEFLTSIEFNAVNKNRKDKFVAKKTRDNIENRLKDAMGSIYFADEKVRFSRYEDYRLIDAYIPELAKCIDLYRDCIMSPDDVTKKSLNYYHNDTLLSASNSDNNSLLDNIRRNINFLDTEYKLSKEAKANIRESLLLGDLFTIILDIREATAGVLQEDHEDDIFVKENSPYTNIITEQMIDFESLNFKSLFEEDTSDSQDSKTENTKNKANSIEKAKKDVIDSINNNVKFYRDPKTLMSEIKKMEREENVDLISKLRIKGSIVKIPKPENIIKIEVDKHCFGYIYIEKSDFTLGDNQHTIKSLNSVNRLVSNNSNDVFNARYDFLQSGSNDLKDKYDILSDIFIRGISKKIDCKFINKNQDFKRVIYDLLKQDYILNKQVNITFLDPSDVFHFKLDSNDVYGISKLAKSLFFAKLYLATLITNLMQKISRGRDKRAFYIDTGLDDDMEGTVQSFIRDIKSREITTDTLNSITTLLNTVGSFEDYFLPTIDGQKPLEIDTISGMDVSSDQDFLENLLKSAISGTDTPVNYIDATHDVDFARTLAMQNQTFVRNIVGYQSDYSDYYTQIIRRLYFNEFIKYKDNDEEGERNDIDINQLFVKFPSPVYLSINNLNDQISSTSSTLDFLLQLYFSENMDDPTLETKKNDFKKMVCKEYFLPTMEWDLFDKIYNKVIDSIQEKSIKTPKDDSTDDMNSDMGNDDNSDDGF